jgi:hypothetical protein
MRKASKAKIAEHMKAYGPWRAEVDARVAKLPEQARGYLTEWADDVRTRVEAGEIGVCTRALVQSVIRDVLAWEQGYYKDRKGNANIVA